MPHFTAANCRVPSEADRPAEVILALNEYGDGFWCIHLDCCTATAASMLLQRTLSKPRAHYCGVKMVKYRSLLAVLGSLLAVSASSSPERL